ncbi:hypothetical protein GQ42DRAFT_105930, partial [Ramicandelaber brevisporus]
MIALCYLERLRSKLNMNSIGHVDTPHRLFMGAIMLADKYLNDSSNVTTKFLSGITSGIWQPKDVLEIEQMFLKMIDHNINVDRDQLVEFL